ncbi:hypothetical protein R1T16_09490 [Flavobacterium sp. DG1-102-2]|uniref:hypothetical protein n=1 Tax=Flavobacterium sp. DG1-102-2 TaxID=3081663 RepID=UPI0029496C6C|nr:hypothetical protein [Flavobacterium sp. DG1-102-2]MDV6168656.1 hypothetical protein [Flavobacterium sp. DG1-102-2]
MSRTKNIIAGLGGAIALNILHEALKKRDKDMPRVDLLGEEALEKSLDFFDAEIQREDTLYKMTLAGDIISNTLYYSAIGAGASEHVWSRAITMGITAGIGAITLPEPLGLDDKPVARTTKTKALTIGYYLLGALVTGALVKALNRNEE